MQKQPEVTDATRKAIVDAFWAIYQTTPIDKISIKRVTDAAHVHRSTFYRYFSYIYEVLNALEGKVMEEIAVTLQTKVQPTQMTDLLTHADVMVSALKDYAPILSHLTGPTGDADFRDKLREQMRMTFRRFVPNNGTLEADYLFCLIFNTILFNLSYWHENRETCTLEEVSQLSRQLIHSGIGAYVAKMESESK